MSNSQDPFVSYYEKQSESSNTTAQFRAQKDGLLRILGRDGRAVGVRIADIGCGAGTFSRIWAADGAIVSGIDVNPALVEIARRRAKSDGLTIDFRTGSAETLPWPDRSFDLVMMPELLEHVTQWRQCLSQAARVLDSGGLLYLSTTNRLCPKQEEFSLPLYSWYPAWLKDRCLARARTDRRHWVQHAEFPALHWFSPYGLAAELEQLDLLALDRFSIWERHSPSVMKRLLGKVAVSIPPLRFVGHVMSPSTRMIGIKRPIVT
jgi:2-polyprenyl-6-hydroxyphenyl methylase/3-demethylubiquinone-9 3-methyltransferase